MKIIKAEHGAHRATFTIDRTMWKTRIANTKLIQNNRYAVHFGHCTYVGKVDLEAAEMAAELIGAPVFAKGGEEVGVVAEQAAMGEHLQARSDAS